MLRTDSHDEAAGLARSLTLMNDERRSEEDRIFKEALQQAQADSDRLGFVLYGRDWHQGVIGIVASRIVEEFYRPVLILCADGDTLKGSGRSVSEFDLHAGLTRVAPTCCLVTEDTGRRPGCVFLPTSLKPCANALMPWSGKSLETNR